MHESASSDSISAKSVLLEALAHLEQGRIEAAVERTLFVLSLRPLHGGAIAVLLQATRMRPVLLRDSRIEAFLQDLARTSQVPARGWLLLGGWHLSGKEYEAARQAFSSALATLPEEEKPEAIRGLVELFLATKKYRLALKAVEQGLERYSEARILLEVKVQALVATRRFESAIEVARALLAENPEDPRQRRTLASLLFRTGDLEAARVEIEQVLEKVPGWTEARATAAMIFARLRRKEEAWTHLEPALEHAHRLPIVAQAYATLAKGTEKAADAAQQLSQVIDSALERGVDEADLYEERMTLGELLADLDRPHEAWQTICSAKRTFEDTSNHAGFIRLVESLAAFFTPARLDQLPAVPPGPERHCRPLFIVGLPRSGTSLTEQMLGRHPEIHPCGELGFLGAMLRVEEQRQLQQEDGKPFPQFLESMSPEALAELAEAYWKGVRQLPGFPQDHRGWFTDKLPYNYLYCGVIHRLFPDARILFCRRNPLDNLLSIFFLNFVSQFSFTYQPADLGFLYRWHDSIMRHYRALLPGFLSEVRYEKLVTQPRQEMECILSWLDLPWAEECLHQHESTRHVHTASWDQVTRPLYTSSIGRHLPFLPDLQPVLATLGPRLAADHYLPTGQGLRPAPLSAPPVADFPFPLPDDTLT